MINLTPRTASTYILIYSNHTGYCVFKQVLSHSDFKFPTIRTGHKLTFKKAAPTIKSINYQHTQPRRFSKLKTDLKTCKSPFEVEGMQHIAYVN